MAIQCVIPLVWNYKEVKTTLWLKAEQWLPPCGDEYWLGWKKCSISWFEWWLTPVYIHTYLSKVTEMSIWGLWILFYVNYTSIEKNKRVQEHHCLTSWGRYIRTYSGGIDQSHVWSKSITNNLLKIFIFLQVGKARDYKMTGQWCQIH